MPAQTGAAAAAVAPASATAVDPVLVATNLFKRYGPVQAVRSVSFHCHRGEVHALIGENGAGKSTIAKILAGATVPTSGSIMLDSAPLVASNVRDARRSGVCCAFQELALVPEWTVAENLSLPDGSPFARFSQRGAITATGALLGRLELPHIDPSSAVSELSLADRQMVEIARAVAATPKVLILDEASSALTPPGVQWLFARIRELTAQGTSIIYVSHRLAEIAEIADRGTVLRDGQVVGEFRRGYWTEDELVSLMAGRETSRQFPSPPDLPETTVQDAVLEVDDLRATGLNGVSMKVAPGEILGVGGLQGHGQGELLRALYGAVPASARTWQIDGRSVSRLTPERAVRLRMGYVPEDRKTEGLALEMSVGENLLAPWFRPFQSGGRPRLRRERSWISSVLESLSVRTRGPFEDAGALSGGNQQKLVFGRWLDRNRRVVLLHDPTRGVDVRAKQELYDTIIQLSRQGVGIVWFSTEVEELVNVCHRVIVLYRGAVADDLRDETLTAAAVVGAAVGTKATA